MATTHQHLPNRELGQRIEKKRQELGMSVREMAAKAGVDYATLWRLSMGRNVQTDTLRKILTCYDIPLVKPAKRKKVEVGA